MNDPFASRLSVPFVGPVTTIAVIGSPSTSLSFVSTPGTKTVRVVFSLTPQASSTATGASFTASTVIVTVATFEPSGPSLDWYVNESVPLKSALGVYTNEPLALSVSVPLVGPATNIAVIGSPSTSLSLVSTPGAAIVSVLSSVAE